MGLLDALTGKENVKDQSNRALSGKKIAFLATDGFEQSELFDPKSILEDAGAEVIVVSPKSGSIKGWNETDWGKKINVDLTVEMAMADDFDGLVLPGGVMNPDSLRQNKAAIAFVRGFVEAGKPIGAICHGPQILIEVDAALRGNLPEAAGIRTTLLADEEDSVSFLKGRKMTSFPSLRTDLMNAGANWVDEEVVCDQGLVTSRKPADIPAFASTMIEEFAMNRDSRDNTHTVANRNAIDSYYQSPDSLL